MADKISTLADELAGAIRESGSRKTSAYDTPAVVRRVDGSTAWVHIPGGVDETPVQLTVAASAGDTVQVRVSGGRAWMVGNASAPPTDDRVAVAAREKADEAAQVAEAAETLGTEAREVAQAAARIAADTEQHFWFTETGADTGAHITEVTQEDFLADPDNGGGNLLARSNGIALREGLIELATLQQSGMDINTYDNGGNAVNIAHLGYGEGNAQSGTAIAPYYTLGTRKTTASAYDSTSTYDVGDLCIYGGAVYVCVVKIAVAEPWTDYHWKRDIGNYSVAMGNNVIASGSCSHAEGNGTIANGWLAHAEGEGALAAGSYSHAEGSYTTAANFNSHAEGYSTYAGSYAHAEGHSSKASGYASHAQNQGTTASYNFQTTIGQFNDNQNDTALEIGNGTDDANRSNALTVDWSGLINAGTTAGIDSALTTLGWSSVKDGSLLGIQALLEKILDRLALYDKPLVTNANWSSGTLSVPGSSKYRVFEVVQGGAATICTRYGNDLRGFSLSGNSTANNWNQYVRAFGATADWSTEVWTLEWAKQLSHVTSSGYHTSGTTQAVTEIRGLIPLQNA